MAKLMLVEDDNNLREIYGARLMAEGYDIISAADGEEALALAVKEKPDLIISDVMMPKISGFDMLDILRTTPETKDTKVIMMTALSQPEDRQRGESLGADKYLVKSQVTLEDVVVAVHEILGDGPAPTAPVNDPTPPTVVEEPAAATPPAPDPTPAPDSNPTPSPDPNPSPPTDDTPPAMPSADDTPVSNEQGPPDVQQPPDENNLPKADGASDAPEPASRKKKVITPINDLSHDKDKLMQMAAQEAALEAQAMPQAMPPQPVETADSALPAPEPAPSSQPMVGSVPDETTPAETTPPPNPDFSQQRIAQDLSAEKAQMEAEVQELLNNGTIDAEANAAPVEVDSYKPPIAAEPATESDQPTNPEPMLMPDTEPSAQTVPGAENETPPPARPAPNDAPEPVTPPTENQAIEPGPSTESEQDIGNQIAEMVNADALNPVSSDIAPELAPETEPETTPVSAPEEATTGEAEVNLPSPQIPAAQTTTEAPPAEPQAKFDPNDPSNISL